MSMKTIMHECEGCERRCFDVQACPDCKGVFLCADCRKACPECDESVCYDHWNEKAKTCAACERTRMIESGEALEEWKWSGGY